MLPRIKIIIAGRPIGKKAQASLEMAVAVICVCVLLFGVFSIFMWVTNRIVTRQELYEGSRVLAAGKEREEPHQPVLAILETSFPELHIYNE